ncbi:MAG: hypothetical protein HY323_08040 [Betaproteobacteria bacterium]|nr:hypothetical protein [Betaproteobacteria bacterium]
MDKVLQLSPSAATFDQQLEFRANTVVVDNPTNQWVSLPSLGIFVPQYTLGATYPLPGTTRARASWTAPAGQVEPPSITGQTTTITFYDIALPGTSGVGMLGGRAPYYDRNPTSFTRSNAQDLNQNSGTTQLWTYTVPAGRRSYVEAMQVYTEITVAYGAGGTNLYTAVIANFSLGGLLLVARIPDVVVAAGTFSEESIGASIELQAGENIFANAVDSRAAGAGVAQHFAVVKLTEFDA